MEYDHIYNKLRTLMSTMDTQEFLTHIASTIGQLEDRLDTVCRDRNSKITPWDD